MKPIGSNILFGKNAVSGAIALSIVLLIALGCTCGKFFSKNGSENTSNIASNIPLKNVEGGDLPSNPVVQGLVKDTIGLLADAVKSGDFSDLYSKASSDFRSQYTINEVQKTFKAYVDKKSLVAPILNKAKGQDPKFSSPPSLRSEKNLKILVANGKFDTKPYSVRFDTEYIFRDGEWKMLKLVVNIP
jgi:hypothetical protein